MRVIRFMLLLALVLSTVVACGDDDDQGELASAEDDDDDDDDNNDNDDDDTTPPFEHEVFTHEFPDGLADIATGDFEKPAVEYGVVPVSGDYRHVLNFQMSPLMPPWRQALPTNGPLVLYTDDLDVVVFSPLDHFFVSLIWMKNGAIHYGLEGEVEQVPAGFTHRFLLVKGQGINATIEHWGRLLNADRGRTAPDRYADTGLSYLGFWTDNGAYYYYETEPGMNEHETLLAVRDDADERGIPYGYFQIDSWWYFKDKGLLSPGGLIRWEPQPEMFPDGLAAFSHELGLPLIAHNRWFAKNNDYRDDYPFFDDREMAFPLDGAIFGHFMDNALSWGIETYEQDWLISQFWGVSYLRNGVDHAENYMAWMNDAAVDHGMTMQLCMAGAAFLLDALDRPAATTIRTSIDYHRDLSKESYWPQFHTVNMLAAAVGLWPFKDNFQSSEDHGEAEALISNLSAGMVGPSDRIGLADAELLGRTCRDDGLLLKPDRPATPLDAMFLPHARPYLTRTFSERPQGRWTYLAGYHLAREHPDRTMLDVGWAYISYGMKYVGNMFVFPDHITNWRVDLAADLGIDGPVVVYDWRNGAAEIVTDAFDMPAFEDLYDFAYFVLAPILDNGLALIGEPEKFITLADKRFVDLVVREDSVEVTLVGVPGETIKVLAYDADAGAMLTPINTTIGEDGTAPAIVSR